MKKAAIGIIFSSDRQQILLIQRRDIPIWVLPGGGVEDNETAFEAVEREVFEETGIQVTADRLVGIYLPINSLASETKVFECISKVDIPSLPSTTSEEAQNISFFPLAALPKFFFFLHHEWVKDAIENRYAQKEQPIVKYMTHITWWALFKQGLRHPLFVMRYLLSRLGIPINSRKKTT